MPEAISKNCRVDEPHNNHIWSDDDTVDLPYMCFGNLPVCTDENSPVISYRVRDMAYIQDIFPYPSRVSLKDINLPSPKLNVLEIGIDRLYFDIRTSGMTKNQLRNELFEKEKELASIMKLMINVVEKLEGIHSVLIGNSKDA